jgi:hypothetical protein
VGTEMHHLFIDFKAAYATIDRTRLYLAAEEMQIPKKFINLITTTIRNTKYQIRIQATLSEHLPIKNEVCQGDALACLLFNIVL